MRGFLASRGITLPEGSPGDPPDAATVQAIATRKNELVLRELDEHGVEVYDGSVRYLRAVKDAGLATAVVTASANGEQVIAAGGFADLIDAARRRASWPPGTSCAASPSRTPSWRAPGCSAWSPRRRSSSRTRSPACRRAGPGTSATSSGSTASGQADALRRPAPTSS